MRYWQFRDYLNEHGKNVFLSELRGYPKTVRSAIHAHITQLEVTKELNRPSVGLLGRKCTGLIELRVKVNRTPYRPLAFRGPGDHEITLLAMAIERNYDLKPPDVCKTALERKRKVLTIRGRTCEHEFA